MTGWNYDPPGDAQLGQKAAMIYDPRGQVIRTLNPDGSEQRVIYGIPAELNNPSQFAPTPWEAYTYDANDLAPVSFHPTEKLPDGTPKPLTDHAPAHHHFTPSSIVIDALGRTIIAVARNRDRTGESRRSIAAVQELRTESTYDIRGNVLTVTDALNRVAFRYSYDLANRPWRNDSIDAGLRRMVLNVIGNEMERRDSKGALILQCYDRLQRPIRLWARDATGSPITLRQRMEYGDGGRSDQPPSERQAMRDKNLLGQLIRHHDEAGVTTVAAVDFKGNMLDKSRRVIADAPIIAVFEQAPANGWQVTPFQVDWAIKPQQTLADREGELLETKAYQTTSSVDALNRIKRMRFPEDVEGQRRELRPLYNNAGGLEKVFLNDTLYVERIAYDAKGQRALIAYGNGVITRYAYDAQTFRLKRLRSERYSKPDDLTYRPGGEALQDFGYDYDLAGNILGIHDRTPESGILNNPEAVLVTGEPALVQLLVSGNALNRRFDYDAIYRLLSATGRECDYPPDGEPWQDQPRCTDLTKTRAYTERYRYDAMGNMLQLAHRNDQGGFTREFTVETANNRLRHLQIGQIGYDYTFDVNGNMRSEATSRHFEWNHSDQMKAFRTQTDGAEPSVHAHYLYDGGGQRVKKLVRKQGGQVEVAHYVDGVFEHHRWGGQAQAGENNHVHVMDDSQRIALVRVGGASPGDGMADKPIQYQLGDHLGSSNVVVDSGGILINREEFTPYGETSFGSFARKRYRFTGMERDEENGFSYHGARYYIAQLATWANCDPASARGGINLYKPLARNPILYIDPDGNTPKSSNKLWQKLCEIVVIIATKGQAGRTKQERIEQQKKAVAAVQTQKKPKGLTAPDERLPDKTEIRYEGKSSGSSALPDKEYLKAKDLHENINTGNAQRAQMLKPEGGGLGGGTAGEGGAGGSRSSSVGPNQRWSGRASNSTSDLGVIGEEVAAGSKFARYGSKALKGLSVAGKVAFVISAAITVGSVVYHLAQGDVEAATLDVADFFTLGGISFAKERIIEASGTINEGIKSIQEINEIRESGLIPAPLREPKSPQQKREEQFDKQDRFLKSYGF